MDSTVIQKIIIEEKDNIAFMVDEILIKVVNQQDLIWIAINSIDKVILDISIFKRSMLVAEEQFLNHLIEIWKILIIRVSSRKRYLQTCKFVKVDHRIHILCMRKTLSTGLSVYQG